VEVAEPIKTADEPVVVQLKQAPVLAIKPTGEEVELAQVVTPPPAQALVAHTSDNDRKLPKTASPLPLIGLFGLLLLGGAFALRFVERRAL
jgi:MYXO-CTERM domain-containing protein